MEVITHFKKYFMFTFIENILNSFESIRSNKLRSALSMLWIIIWVASVIILNAMWNWSTQEILNQIEALWTNILTVSPGWGWGSSRDRATAWDILDENVVDSLKENISWLDWVLPVINSNWQLVYSWKDMNASVYWIDENYLPIRDIEITFGSNISESNLQNMERVAIVWQTVLSELFTSNPIWERIKMWNNVFEVIWIIEENMLYDSSIFIPITTASIRVTWNKYYSQIVIAVTDSNEVTQKEAEVDALLQKELKVIDENSLPYRITNQWEMLESITSIMATMTLFLAWIAAISLLVWWIWVMNIMLVSVTERTKEIWIRKAIWASWWDILIQFLTEASTLSILWGTIWIWISYLVVYILAYFNIPWVISVNSIALSFWFSLWIWLIFWIVPAYKAAQLRPIDALRFE